MLWIGIALFVVLDSLVVYAVMKQVVAKRAGLGGAGLADVARFAKVAADETRNYMSANYGGDAAALPAVMQGLVERLSERAREEGLAIGREALKQAASASVILQKSARVEDVNAAMKSVA